MKRKPRLAPRNPFVVPAKHRKAGAHGKTEKATRRAEKIQLQREYGVKTAQRPLNLETSVGRARWCVRAGGWREGTTRQAHACKEERQSQTPARTCQRVRSALTQQERVAKVAKVQCSLVVQRSGKRSTEVSRFQAPGLGLSPSAPTMTAFA